MSDQADGLRHLVQSRPDAVARDEPPGLLPERARTLMFTSGKGGVGTSNLALNLAIALGESGQRVALVDADLGLANLDLLCGLTPRCDLGDVLAGGRPLADAVVAGPGGIRLVAGAHGLRAQVEDLDGAPGRLAAELAELAANADFLLVDAGSGLGAGIGTLAAAADVVVVVTTPEPTALADAHAAIARLHRAGGGAPGPALRAVVNQAAGASEAADCLGRLVASSREFLGVVLTPLGHVRADPRVRAAVRRRRPFVLEYPAGAAARGVRRLARALIEERRPCGGRAGPFAALAAWCRGRARGLARS